MGAALGGALSLALIWIPAIHVASLIDHSMERGTTMLVVVGALMATFGVDATLTGFLLLMIDDHKSFSRK
jgi:predicted metal-binding membrane protein